jgi:hypothetical protein
MAINLCICDLAIPRPASLSFAQTSYAMMTICKYRWQQSGGQETRQIQRMEHNELSLMPPMVLTTSKSL